MLAQLHPVITVLEHFGMILKAVEHTFIMMICGLTPIHLSEAQLDHRVLAAMMELMGQTGHKVQVAQVARVALRVPIVQ
jgi:hypothetical protein